MTCHEGLGFYLSARVLGGRSLVAGVPHTCTHRQKNRDPPGWLAPAISGLRA